MPSRRSLLHLLTAGSLAAAGLPAIGAIAQSSAPVAPEFTGIDDWINTTEPLSLAGLRGKVVLVDFWTYSCINCRRTVRYLNRWAAQYGERGLQVVGIHTPEFGFERVHHNVANAVREFGIHYPVGQDNDFQTWRAWDNEAWPAFYLLDRSGRIVLVREGEGHAHELESTIRALLGLAPAFAPVSGDDPDLSGIRSPEIYFGARHPTPQDPSQKPRQGEATYVLPADRPTSDEYQLDGTWLRQEDALLLRSPRGSIRLRFDAAKLHVVASAPEPAILRITADDGPTHTVDVGRPTLYTLFDSTTYGQHLLTLEAETRGLSLYSATFG